MITILAFLMIGTIVWMLVHSFVEDGEVAYLPAILRVPTIILMAPIGLILHTVVMLIDLFIEATSRGNPKKVIDFYLEDWRNLPEEVWNALRGIPHG